jgi:hypothetical protein
MRWLFFSGFVAALICSVYWTALIIFSIVTSRLWGMGVRGVALVAPLVFFIWGARQMFQAFQGKGLDEQELESTLR